jgi:hypothetical protein
MTLNLSSGAASGLVLMGIPQMANSKGFLNEGHLPGSLIVGNVLGVIT